MAKENKTYAGFAKVATNMVAGQTGFMNYDDRYAAYAPVEGTDGWSIAVTVSQGDYVGSFLLSIVGIIVVMAIATVMSIKIAKQLGMNIAAPIDACTERIKLLAEGLING